MAWAALQQLVIAGNADAETAAAKCIEGCSSFQERGQELVKLYITGELPESVRSLLALTFADEPGECAPAGGSVAEPDTAAPVNGEPPRQAPAARETDATGVATPQTFPYQTARYIRA